MAFARRICLVFGTSVLAATVSGCSMVGLLQGEASNSGLSQQEFCSRLNSVYGTYLEESEAFRRSDSTVPWTVYDDLVDRATSELSGLSVDVNAGIDWDSAAIVSGLVNEIAFRIEEIHTSVQRGQFQPGRDLFTIESDMNLAFQTLARSACEF